MRPWLMLAVGILIGANVGFFLAALCAAAKRGRNDRSERGGDHATQEPSHQGDEQCQNTLRH